MNNLKTILSTKKLPKLQKQLLLDAKFEIIENDYIETTFIDFDLKTCNETLIFTSQNAVHAVLNNQKVDDLKLKTTFCVGLNTKALLQKNGFKVEAYTNYADDLAEIISLIYTEETFTFFSGNLRQDTLPNALTDNGIRFNEIRVYKTELTPQKTILKPSRILFFSPSAVKSYLLLNTITNEICFAIGKTTAAELEKNNIKNIKIADFPSVDSVIDKVISL